VARITSRPFDRARPLWELYLIHGLRDGHVAMLTKVHHALIDGISDAEILGLLLDLGPDAPLRPEEREWKGEAEEMPGTGQMLARAALGIPRYPLRLLRALPSALPNVEDTPFGVLPGASIAGGLGTRVRKLLGGRVPQGSERFTAPRTSFNGRISPHRRFTFGQLALDDVKAIKDDYGCTVNDAIMSICAGAVRRWLIEHDELPDQPLVAQVTFRLSTSSAAHPTWNLVISNVPGPRIPLYCAGARLVANYPVSVITDGMGLNITVMSYLGKLILVRRGMLPYLRGSRRAELHTHDGRRRREGSPTGHRDGRLVGSGHRRSAGGAP
jgi:diacylglycerol O-acyltransferase